ncbi:MAG TPA: zf-TFIIB domain-containing protein [Miltoncostaeaceae bacterium]|jgi:Zn-finger nucleic acid-binding protein|nr:zf-TFIIB domain-containing protein [Miltoncostaeaceae bacterium]
MRCPDCTTTRLRTTERLNLWCDYCPDCGGLWVRRPAIDRLVHEAVATAAAGEATESHDLLAAVFDLRGPRP